MKPQSPSGIERTRFDVASLPPSWRYEVWRESIACVFEVEAPKDQRDGESFHASVDALRLDDIILAETRGVGQDWQRSPFAIARDGMDHYMIQLFRSGSVQWQKRRGEVNLRPGDLLVFDLGEEARTRTDSFANLSLVLPRACLAPLLVDPDGQQLRRLDPCLPMAAVLRDYLRLLSHHLPRLTAEEAASLRPAIFSMVASCLNDPQGGAPLEESTARRWRLRGQVRDYLRRNLADPKLDPDAICDAFNLSRSTLYRLFPQENGVMHQLREERLKCALRLLLGDPALPVGEVARRCGFSSASDFSRAFTRRFGRPPRATRRRTLRSYRRDLSEAASRLERDYESWLHQLHSADSIGQSSQP